MMYQKTDKNKLMTQTLLYEYYGGQCPLSEVYLMYMTFQELAVLLSSGD
jgi:hypothetical protein